MRKLLLLTSLLVVGITFCMAKKNEKINPPSFPISSNKTLVPQPEGLWAIATGWQDDWMTGWKYANPTSEEQSGDWHILKGSIVLPQGEMKLRDAYKELKPGLIKYVRRYEWTGKEPLTHATLSVRWRMEGENLSLFMPGILYYGNKNGAAVNSNIIPVYEGKEGEFAIFEDHRFPMPFVMLEDGAAKNAAAIHTTPSPVRGAVLADQWWSMGVEAGKGYTDFVLYSGPIGYNKQHSVAKALQQRPMRYSDTYITMEPGKVIEKEFYIETYAISRPGTGFQQPVYTSMDIHKPFDVDKFADFQSIIESKYRFALNRWFGFDSEKQGFSMYDLSMRKDIVMGWCGQADSPGYALQVLGSMIGDGSIPEKVQKSMDYLSTFPVDETTGVFPVGFNGEKYHGGDHVSCGQAMYNFSKAIETARKSKKYNTAKWEAFLKKSAEGQSKRILDPAWNPVSTAEGFYIAPLIRASKLFKNKKYEQAAVKAAQVFADRHLQMNGCYWGGTLDATCEDKEGSWAAFQGFLELYEQLGEKKYLDWAKHAMDVCLSYTVVWDIPLPAGRMADYNFKTTGWTVVSPQNQHIDVYGVIFTPEIYKMGTYLKDKRLQDLAKVMFRSCYQLTNIYGSQGEQLQQTNFAQHGDMSNVYKLRGGYSEGWTVFWITAHFLNAGARFMEMNVIP